MCTVSLKVRDHEGGAGGENVLISIFPAWFAYCSPTATTLMRQAGHSHNRMLAM